MRTLRAITFSTLLLFGCIYLATGQIPSILPISPVTESIVFQKNVTIDGVANFYADDTTYYSILQGSDAEGLAGGDLRIGLDEALRTLIICDRGDIGTDFGLAAATHPTLIIFDNAGGASLTIDNTSLFANTSLGLAAFSTISFTVAADVAAGDMFDFISSAGVELTDSDGPQAWVLIELKANQTSTAALDALYINGTLTSLGDGSTGDGNNYFRIATGGSTLFRIDTTGGIHPDGLKSGTDQAAAGAAAGELYIDTNDDNTIKIGV